MALVQVGSDGIFASAGTRSSLPAHLSPSFGAAVYGVIERVAPAPYVEAMLERAAFERGDLNAARLHASRLPASARRDDLLGQIALASGDERAAQEHFLAADDVFAIGAEVTRLSKTQPAQAYDLEMRLKDRLERATTHPDALAESYWRLGQLAALQGYTDPPNRTSWWRIGMRDYRQAAALSPLTEKYLLAAGSQALNLRDWPAARRYFRRAADVNPASADAYAGMGIAALRMGDRASARADAARSRAYDPHANILRELETLLQ